MPTIQATAEKVDERDSAILECVKTATGPITSLDIAAITEIPHSTIRRRVRRLIDRKMIERRDRYGPLFATKRKRN